MTHPKAITDSRFLTHRNTNEILILGFSLPNLKVEAAPKAVKQRCF